MNTGAQILEKCYTLQWFTALKHLPLGAVLITDNQVWKADPLPILPGISKFLAEFVTLNSMEIPVFFYWCSNSHHRINTNYPKPTTTTNDKDTCTQRCELFWKILCHATSGNSYIEYQMQHCSSQGKGNKKKKKEEDNKEQKVLDISIQQVLSQRSPS